MAYCLTKRFQRQLKCDMKKEITTMIFTQIFFFQQQSNDAENLTGFPW